MRKPAPLRLSMPADTRTEAQRQTEGVKWLRSMGYNVDLVGQSRRPTQCPNTKCRTMVFPKGDVGNTVGVADTKINHPKRWQSPLIEMPIEWKDCPDPGTEKGRHAQWFKSGERKEQEARFLAGRIVVVWDLLSLAQAVARFETDVLDIELDPMMAALIAQHAPKAAREEAVAA